MVRSSSLNGIDKLLTLSCFHADEYERNDHSRRRRRSRRPLESEDESEPEVQEQPQVPKSKKHKETGDVSGNHQQPPAQQEGTHPDETKSVQVAI
jgi:hypothetical protein